MFTFIVHVLQTGAQNDVQIAIGAQESADQHSSIGDLDLQHFVKPGLKQFLRTIVFGDLFWTKEIETDQ